MGKRQKWGLRFFLVQYPVWSSAHFPTVAAFLGSGRNYIFDRIDDIWITELLKLAETFGDHSNTTLQAGSPTEEVLQGCAPSGFRYLQG